LGGNVDFFRKKNGMTRLAEFADVRSSGPQEAAEACFA